MKPAHSQLSPEVATIKEAAQILGVTHQAVYAGVRNGRLKAQQQCGRLVVQREGLERRWWGSSQRVADHHREPNWQQVAALLNAYLPDWPAPPWDADQACTLAQCVAMAQEGRQLMTELG